jgi:hypothetical protein
LILSSAGKRVQNRYRRDRPAQAKCAAEMYTQPT